MPPRKKINLYKPVRLSFSSHENYFTLLTLESQKEREMMAGQEVTIILWISFQLSYNKADKDPYNPIQVARSALITPAIVWICKFEKKFSGGIHVWFE